MCNPEQADENLQVQLGRYTPKPKPSYASPKVQTDTQIDIQPISPKTQTSILPSSRPVNTFHTLLLTAWPILLSPSVPSLSTLLLTSSNLSGPPCSNPLTSSATVP